MKRIRRIILALTLILAIAVSGAASLWMLDRLGILGAAQEPSAEAAAELPAEKAPRPGPIKPPEPPAYVPAEEPEVPAEEPEEAPEEAPEEEPVQQPSEEPDAPEVLASDEMGSAEMYVPAETPSVVSLYTVDMINSRPRSLTAVKTRVIASSRYMRLAMDMHRELTYQNAQLGDLSMLEVYRDDGTEKPLLLFLHGLGNDKESLTTALSAFAEAGYYAVGVDAFDQGDRYLEDSSVDTWAAVLITVADIDPIIEYYQTVENVDAERFVLGGFSMGAVEATAYLETGSYEPAAVIALCGLCELDAWQNWQLDDLTYGWLSDWWGTVWTFPEQQALGYTGAKFDSITSMDVTSNLNSFSDTPILCCVGTADIFFNARSIQNVMQQIQDSGNAEAECIVYPFGMHLITNNMLNDCLDFLSELI